MNVFETIRQLPKMTIVCDIDEIVVLQTPKWCANIYHQLKDDPEVTAELNITEDLLDPVKVLKRSEYYLTKWLIKDGIEKVSDSVYKKLMDVYEQDPNFYDDIEPTPIGKTLAQLVSTNKVDFIYYVTKSPDCPAWASKMRFIERYLYVDRKTQVIKVPLQESKSDYVDRIIDKKQNVNILIEDEPNNIFKMLDGCFKNNMITVLTPVYGYCISNTITLEQLEQYYNNDKVIRIYY